MGSNELSISEAEVIFLALALANAAADFHPAFPVMFSGPQQSLEQLVVAARKCGYADASVGHGSGNHNFVALEGPTREPIKGPWACTFKWVSKHPAIQINFLGNAER